jgi:hypothetical protein
MHTAPNYTSLNDVLDRTSSHQVRRAIALTVGQAVHHVSTAPNELARQSGDQPCNRSAKSTSYGRRRRDETITSD